eukprot:1160137-Pelagomonas_calceolata.AAC.10
MGQKRTGLYAGPQFKYSAFDLRTRSMAFWCKVSMRHHLARHYPARHHLAGCCEGARATSVRQAQASPPKWSMPIPNRGSACASQAVAMADPIWSIQLISVPASPQIPHPNC